METEAVFLNGRVVYGVIVLEDGQGLAEGTAVKIEPVIDSASTKPSS
jgi:hypothetical protein